MSSEVSSRWRLIDCGSSTRWRIACRLHCGCDCAIAASVCSLSAIVAFVCAPLSEVFFPVWSVAPLPVNATVDCTFLTLTLTLIIFD